MRTAGGIKAAEGIAIGRIRICRASVCDIDDSLTEDTAAELARFEQARIRVQEQQRVLYERARQSAGEESAAIFEAHELMLDDEDLVEACTEIILKQRHRAGYAVQEAFDNAAQMFRDMEDPYFQARSADVVDLKNAMLDVLLGRDTDNEQGTEPFILVAEDLTPSETVKLDKSLLLGFVTREGSASSHTAILARSMNLPALIQCRDISEDWDGKFAILDGYNACLYIEPTQDLVESFTGRRSRDLEKEALLRQLMGASSTTMDGRSVRVFANIGGPDDVDAVLANDAEGVGLFRSEFVYLNSRTDPTEDQQFEAYKRVLKTLAPRQVIIRTCDIGADKTIGYMNLDREENPALGYRAIRICLTRRDFFRRQLRALLRASAFGRLGIMFPMIISLREVRECREILEECRRELEGDGVKISPFEVGIMIETPAAALCADELAEEVDFFSLGTNDLTQYTCAIDRQNAKLEPFSDPHHPAVLRLIRMTVEAARRHNIWVGICGELGADTSLTETFLRMGVDELSVNPGSVLPLRRIIRSLDLSRPVGQALIQEE
ncbi:MAG: phosphoenolpyruvate--protein phosphotransferase [Fretibacterium sp.]|nr:phosphoenolpyruvate--protein phosphotransferase [Fretibacterium sp.]